MIFGDTHCDVIGCIADKNEGLYKNSCRFSLELLEKYDGFIQFFACFISPRFYGAPKKRFYGLAEKYFSELDKNRGRIWHCTCLEEAHRALAKGGCAAFLTAESGEWIESAEDLEYAYSLGVRVIGLTWDGDNRLASGSASPGSGGLTGFGREMVRKMNTLGIHIDVSHLNDRSFYDVCSLAERPLFATHSNSRAVCPSVRNLTDEQFRLIAESGGFVGINMYNPFLKQEGRVGIEDVIRHIEHFLNLGGENCIGFGADFDGMEDMPDGIENAGDMCKIREEMLKNEYNKRIVDKIAHKNLERAIKFF
ncbi:MAG: membrane dipeptidase [Clostridia bacterium]|nr:membrane dipeptidase [Clostridia bacterium]